MHRRSIHRVKRQRQNAEIIIALKSLHAHGFDARYESQEEDSYADAVECPYLWEELYRKNAC